MYRPHGQALAAGTNTGGRPGHGLPGPAGLRSSLRSSSMVQKPRGLQTHQLHTCHVRVQHVALTAVNSGRVAGNNTATAPDAFNGMCWHQQDVDKKRSSQDGRPMVIHRACKSNPRLCAPASTARCSSKPAPPLHALGSWLFERRSFFITSKSKRN